LFSKILFQDIFMMIMHHRNTRFLMSYVLLLFISSLLYSCKNEDKTKTAPRGSGPVEADVIVIKKQDFSYGIEANGSVLANEFVELKPEISGRLVQLNIAEGSHVSEGTLLAKIYDEDLQAQLRKYQSQLEIANKTVERFGKLLEVNGLNQQEYDQAVSVSDGLRADLDYTKAQIRKTEIRAPFSGLIGLRSVSPGAYVTQAQVLATLQQVSNLKVDFVLPENQMHMVKNGMMVHLKSAQGIEHTAKVIAIEPQINAATRNVKVRAIIQDKAEDITPGSFVVVGIDASSSNEGSILIPTNAIIPESRSKKVAVLKNGVIHMQEIETGYRTSDRVVVTKGLNEGDTVAVSAILFLKPGAEVKIRNVVNN
jgi:membrane fusion protein (multidrug efflux system)